MNIIKNNQLNLNYCNVCDVQFNTLYMIRHLEQHYGKQEWAGLILYSLLTKCITMKKPHNFHDVKLSTILSIRYLYNNKGELRFLIFFVQFLLQKI